MQEPLELQALLQPGGGTMIPGVADPLVGQLAQRVGFKAVYISGGVTANAVHGLPDIGLVTMDEMAERAGQIARAVEIPAIADADTGYGNALNVMRTVERYQREGIAGLHIEDQVFPKRCGHVQGKQVVDTDEMVGKIRAAIAARAGQSPVIIARTDARAVHGFDDALERAKRLVDAGADAIFPEALESEDEFARFAEQLPGVPLVANMTEFGRTPLIRASTFADLGYAAVIFPVTVTRVTLFAARAFLRDLVETGTQSGWMDQMLTRRELYELVGYGDWIEREAEFVPEGGIPPIGAT